MKNHTIMLADPASEMSRVLNNQPELIIVNDNPPSICCYKWPHGPLHEIISPLDQHVIIAHYGNMQRVERTTDNKVSKNVIRNGAITTIPLGSSSYWDVYNPVDVIHFYLPNSILNTLAQQVDVSEVELKLHTGLYDIVTSKIIVLISELLVDNNKINQLLCEHLLLVLMVQLIKNHSAANIFIEQSNGGLSPRALKYSIEKLDSSPVGDVSIKSLSEELGLSSAHFCRAFKSSTGVTPYSWLKQRVIERASLQLELSEKPIFDIALESGYSSQNAFTLAFRKLTGISPGQWRNKKQHR